MTGHGRHRGEPDIAVNTAPLVDKLRVSTTSHNMLHSSLPLYTWSASSGNTPGVHLLLVSISLHDWCRFILSVVLYCLSVKFPSNFLYYVLLVREIPVKLSYYGSQETIKKVFIVVDDE